MRASTLKPPCKHIDHKASPKLLAFSGNSQLTILLTCVILFYVVIHRTSESAGVFLFVARFSPSLFTA